MCVGVALTHRAPPARQTRLALLSRSGLLNTLAAAVGLCHHEPLWVASCHTHLLPSTNSRQADEQSKDASIELPKPINRLFGGNRGLNKQLEHHRVLIWHMGCLKPTTAEFLAWVLWGLYPGALWLQFYKLLPPDQTENTHNLQLRQVQQRGGDSLFIERGKQRAYARPAIITASLLHLLLLLLVH